MLCSGLSKNIGSFNVVSKHLRVFGLHEWFEWFHYIFIERTIPLASALAYISHLFINVLSVRQLLFLQWSLSLMFLWNPMIIFMITSAVLIRLLFFFFFLSAFLLFIASSLSKQHLHWVAQLVMQLEWLKLYRHLVAKVIIAQLFP